MTHATDTRLQQAKQAFLAEPTPEAAHQWIGLAERAGAYDADEAVCFLRDHYEGERMDRYRDLSRLEQKREEEFQRLYREMRAAANKPWICVRCHGRGRVAPAYQCWSTGADWRMNDPVSCPVCTREDRVHPIHMVREGDPKIEADSRRCAYEAYKADLDAAAEAHREAHGIANTYDHKTRCRRGARVVLSNKRARPKFGSCRERCGACEICSFQGERVPHGTEGEVFWLSPEDGETIGVRTDEGLSFFTKIRHVEVLNPHALLAGKDTHTLAQEKRQRKRDQRAAEEAEKATQTWGDRTPSRGDKVVYKGEVLKVFWAGTTRRGDFRLGLKQRISDRGEAPTWVALSEVVPA